MRKKGRHPEMGGESCWGGESTGGQSVPSPPCVPFTKNAAELCSAGQPGGKSSLPEAGRVVPLAKNVRAGHSQLEMVETNISRKADCYELWIELTTRCVLLRMNTRRGTQPTARSTWGLQRAPDGSTE